MRVGFIGLGTMGAPMARRLVGAGLDVVVHNRTREREEGIGADRAASPADAARGAGVVVTMVSDTPDVEAVLFGDRGVASTVPPDAVAVDMSTISPAATREFGERLPCEMVDAPVSGGPEGAAAGTLAIMAGGSLEAVAQAQPVLDVLGRVTHVGPLGSGQATKAVNQVVIGGFYQAMAEGLVLGMAQGLDMDRVVGAISGGACRSWVLENRARNVLEDRYPLGFKLSLHLRDLRIALESGIDLPLARMVRAIEEGLASEGFGDEDVSAIAREARRRAGLS
jgi:3-hydroxyisobutyrate dehydrogenase